jgi:hypothetical protein
MLSLPVMNAGSCAMRWIASHSHRPSAQLMVEQTAVAADRALRTRQVQAGILVASDTHMKALDGAALRYLSAVLDVHGMEIISGSTTFLGALCRLHTEAGPRVRAAVRLGRWPFSGWSTRRRFR